jgi:hypothetical protein
VPIRKTTPAPTSAQGSNARIHARGPDDGDEEDDFVEAGDFVASDAEGVGDAEEVGEDADESGTLRFRTSRGGRRYRRCSGVGGEARVVGGGALVDHCTIVPASPRV